MGSLMGPVLDYAYMILIYECLYDTLLKDFKRSFVFTNESICYLNTKHNKIKFHMRL